MPLLFSYGTLQQESVQLSAFGRLLEGQCDDLPSYESTQVKIENPQLAAISGRTYFDNALFTGSLDTCVRGMAFEVTEAELAAADRYEKPAGYIRIAVSLASGKPAWVYVDARTVPRTV